MDRSRVVLFPAKRQEKLIVDAAGVVAPPKRDLKPVGAEEWTFERNRGGLGVLISGGMPKRLPH